MRVDSLPTTVNPVVIKSGRLLSWKHHNNLGRKLHSSKRKRRTRTTHTHTHTNHTHTITHRKPVSPSHQSINRVVPSEKSAPPLQCIHHYEYVRLISVYFIFLTLDGIRRRTNRRQLYRTIKPSGKTINDKPMRGIDPPLLNMPRRPTGPPPAQTTGNPTVHHKRKHT